MRESEEQRIRSLGECFRRQRLEGVVHNPSQARKHRRDPLTRGLFGGHCGQLIMRVGSGQADEFRACVSTGSCDHNPKFFGRFHVPPVSRHKKGKAEEPSLLMLWLLLSSVWSTGIACE